MGEACDAVGVVGSDALFGCVMTMRAVKFVADDVVALVAATAKMAQSR